MKLQASITIEVEEWVFVPEFEGLYEISSLGNLRSMDRYVKGRGDSQMFKAGKPIKGKLDKDGYISVILSKDGKTYYFQLHRLVMMAFEPNENARKLTVNHENGVKSDNRLSNLTWMTRAENMAHAKETGLMPSGERHYKFKITDEVIEQVKALKKNRPELTQKEIALQFGISPSSVQVILSGKKKASKAV